MAATKAKKTSVKKSGTRPGPTAAIGKAASDLEHEVVAALRAEVKHLKATVESIQKDVRKALDRVEAAIESSTAPARTALTKKAPAKKAVAKKTAAKKSPTKKAPAKKTVAKKAPATKAVAAK